MVRFIVYANNNNNNNNKTARVRNTKLRSGADLKREKATVTEIQKICMLGSALNIRKVLSV